MNDRTYEAEMIRLDQALDKYATAWLTSEATAGERVRDQLDKYLRQSVTKLFARLLTTAEDRTNPFQRVIALAALGFSGRPEALDPMLNAVRGDDHEAGLAALFGLAILQDPNTPAAPIGEVIFDEKKPLEMRRNASLALMKLQEKSYDANAVLPYWVRALELPMETADDGIQLHALRGLGLLRDPQHAGLAERMASHPQPKLRVAAAIAMGRMKNQSSVGPLLALLGPAEKNDNVRLAARKALQELAGGIDREYDVMAWRKAFDRGNG
jgi:HEAT repeat protein